MPGGSHDVLELSIPLIPVPKGRPRMKRRGKAYTPTPTRRYEEAVAWYVKSSLQGREPLQGPIAVELEFWLPIPRSWNQRKQGQARDRELLPTSKPDLGNLVKAVEDACNGLTWVDDSQIVQETARKAYSDQPRIILRMRPLTTS